MSKIHNGFFGHPKKSQTLLYSGGDSEERYYKNLASQPSDWYYKNKHITYKYNSLGHRCKNIADINLDNYILFAGCSHTEGVGLELENTYPYQVSKKSGMDYYNLAVGGAGQDIMTHNLIMFSNIVNKPPKYLIILQPEVTRFATYDTDKSYIKLNNISENNSDITRFIEAGDKLNYFADRLSFNMLLINQLYKNSKILRMDWLSDDENSVLNMLQIDKARDLSHSGIESNTKLANEILESL